MEFADFAQVSVLFWEIMVLLERIELSTSPLPRECSTSELQQRRGRVFKSKRSRVQGQSGRGLAAGLERRR